MAIYNSTAHNCYDVGHWSWENRPNIYQFRSLQPNLYLDHLSAVVMPNDGDNIIPVVNLIHTTDY